MSEKANKQAIERDLQLLELGPDASLEEIEDAFQRLLQRYGMGSLASYGLLRVEERGKLLKAIKAAVLRLLENAGEALDGEVLELSTDTKSPEMIAIGKDGWGKDAHATVPAETEIWKTEGAEGDEDEESKT